MYKMTCWPDGDITVTATIGQMAAVFNEWAKRYAENEEEFSGLINAAGQPDDYGERCSRYFLDLMIDLERNGLLPPLRGGSEDVQFMDTLS